MLMLIHTAEAADEPPSPDDERARRWEPISRRLFLPAAGSVSCLIVGAVTDPLITVVLMLMSIVLCGVFVRVALREDPPGGGPAGQRPPGADR